MLREAQAEKGPEGRKAVLEIIRELQRLRRGDHQMARVRLQEARWEAEQAAAEEAEREDLRQKTARTKALVTLTARRWHQEYCDGLATGTLRPERAAALREYFEENATFLREYGIPDLPTEVPQSNSDQIQPDPTRSHQSVSKDRPGKNRPSQHGKSGASRVPNPTHARSRNKPHPKDPSPDLPLAAHWTPKR